MTSPFVHLHVHTHYSLLDGATRIQGLIERAKQYDMPAVAITDHGNMFGAIEFYSACHAAGIKPIVGCEAYLASHDRRSKDSDGLKESYHILLLAMNREGYQNLLRLSTIGYTEGFYRKPRIDKEVLREHSAGLLCTSTCLGGEIPQTFLSKDRAAAEELAKRYLEIFGPDRFFIELQDHGISEQRQINPELADMARRLGVAVIASNDVHYLEHDDAEAHDVLCCINTASLLSEEDRFKFPTDQFYFKSPDEMGRLFKAYPSALANTLHVAEMCNLELDLTKRHAPVFRVPDNISDDKNVTLTPADYLRKLVYRGAAERYGEIHDELKTRIDYELEVITGKGFASYFLIVWDCVTYARDRGIPIAARGSGCSAVVSYCLYISQPDPIRYELYFERFMDPDRDEMPDIDLDICQEGRAEVIEYVRKKYGHVAQIITFGTLKARAVIKDVARVLGLSFDDANKISKLIPSELNITLDKALAQEPELKKRYESDANVRRVLDIGRRLEGVARNAGVHAAGVVVADEPLVNFLPLYKAAGQDTIITQYDGPTVEKVGLLKMDFLGLRTLTVLERATQLARAGSGDDIDLNRLDLADARVYELFSRGETRGIFQFESGGMRDVIMRMRPNRIEDLIAANALFRPGPMEYIPEYIARKHGDRWTTPHAIMTEILSETYGIMVYQEQVSRIVARLGGIELKSAFRLAKAISKKKTSMIEAMREPFLSGCQRNHVSRETGEQIFEDILKFGGYAFNKAHSTGYALIAYQTAWMKTYHPVEFMAALMTFEMASIEKVAEYREECEALSITIEPPNINASEYNFTVDRREAGSATIASSRNGKTGKASPRGVIRFGLGAIKGVGEKVVGVVLAERGKGGPFTDLFEFCSRIDLQSVNRGVIEALICAGSFDCTGAMRRALMEAVERAILFGQSVQEDRKNGQMNLFGGEASAPAMEVKPKISSAEWTEAEMLAREKAVLGFYITKHPLTGCQALLDACSTAATVDLERFKDGDPVILGGMVSSLRTVVTKNGRNSGKQLGIMILEDLKGKVEAVLFSDHLATYRPMIVPDAVVFLEGSVDRRREEPSVRVSRVVAADQAVAAFARILLIQVTNETPLDRLIDLLNRFRGECPVYLCVETADQQKVQIECNRAMRVSCEPELLHDLANLVGPASIQILGPTRRAMPFMIPASGELQNLAAGFGKPLPM